MREVIIEQPFTQQNMLLDGDLRTMRILYLTEADVEHRQICKLSSTIHPFLFPIPLYKILCLKNHAENEAGRLVTDLFLFFKKALHEVKASCLQFNFNMSR